MAHSTSEQDKRFYDLLDAVKSLWDNPGDTGADSLMETIEEAFEADEISTSQYDKLVRECEELM